MKHFTQKSLSFKWVSNNVNTFKQFKVTPQHISMRCLVCLRPCPVLVCTMCRGECIGWLTPLPIYIQLRKQSSSLHQHAVTDSSV